MYSKTDITLRRFFSVAAVLGSMALVGCDEDPVDPDDHDEGDIAGFRIDAINLALPGGTDRMTLLTYDGPTGIDTLYLPDDSEIDIEIVWLDEHGDVVEPETDEHAWELAENHSAISSFAHSDSEAWQGTFTTLDLLPDNTVYGGFSVTLLHGDEEEFTTPQITAAVEAP